MICFLLPPAFVSAAWLFTRWGLQYGLWSLLPTFAIVVFACAIVCIILATRFALTIQLIAPKSLSALIRIGGSILLWVVISAALATAGMAVVDTLRFPVDSP